MCCCCCRKSVFVSGVWKQMCTCTAYYYNPGSSHIRALVECRNCILCQPVTKSAWSWQHDGFSRKYGWSTLQWTCILHMPQAQPDLSCRGTRHRNSWRPGCLSCCSIYYGNHSYRDLRLCSSISDFYYCRKHSCISADFSA